MGTPPDFMGGHNKMLGRRGVGAADENTARISPVSAFYLGVLSRRSFSGDGSHAGAKTEPRSFWSREIVARRFVSAPCWKRRCAVAEPVGFVLQRRCALVGARVDKDVHTLSARDKKKAPPTFCG